MKEKKVLFVCYGGGHAEILIRVANQLKQSSPEIKIEFLALTTAYNKVKSTGVITYQYKDFKELLPEGYVKFGHNQLDKNLHSEISLDESIAYLGANYVELKERYPDTYLNIFENKGRQAFLPVETMTKIIKKISPQVVVTTNSPRSEQASILAAKKLKLDNICISDLFCINEKYELNADTIVVSSLLAKSNLLKYQPQIKAERILAYGNPCFEDLIDVKKNSNKSITTQIKVLWADQPAIHDLTTDISTKRSSEMINEDLEIFSRYLKNSGIKNYSVTLRPHPSQLGKIQFENFLDNKPGFRLSTLKDANNEVLNNDIIVSFDSTMLLKGAIANKKVIQLNKTSGELFYIPIKELYKNSIRVNKIEKIPHSFFTSPILASNKLVLTDKDQTRTSPSIRISKLIEEKVNRCFTQ